MSNVSATVNEVNAEANDVYARSAVVNKDIASITKTRENNLGRIDVLDKQFEGLCTTYKEKYGVDISEATLIGEIVKESQAKKDDLTLMESAVSLIKAGNIADANKLLGVEVADKKVDFTEEVVKDIVEKEVGQVEVGEGSGEFEQQGTEQAFENPNVGQVGTQPPVGQVDVQPTFEQPNLTINSTQPILPQEEVVKKTVTSMEELAKQAEQTSESKVGNFMAEIGANIPNAPSLDDAVEVSHAQGNNMKVKVSLFDDEEDDGIEPKVNPVDMKVNGKGFDMAKL